MPVKIRESKERLERWLNDKTMFDIEQIEKDIKIIIEYAETMSKQNRIF